MWGQLFWLSETAYKILTKYLGGVFCTIFILTFISKVIAMILKTHEVGCWVKIAKAY